MPAVGSTAKSDERRQQVVEAAVSCFAHKGFYGTNTTEIAKRAGISQPYLYQLYANKGAIFAAAVNYVGALLSKALVAAADDREQVLPGLPAQTLRSAYGQLIKDREVLRFLMQASCATEEPVIREAVRACYARQVELVCTLLDDDHEAVRRWFRAGMLENVVAALDLSELTEPWAEILSNDAA